MIRRSFLPPTKLEFVLNLQAANTLGIKASPMKEARSIKAGIREIFRP
jgi:hypothetical protein